MFYLGFGADVKTSEDWCTVELDLVMKLGQLGGESSTGGADVNWSMHMSASVSTVNTAEHESMTHLD